MENTAPNTNNFLNWVEIKNFKSIKDLRLDCKRVNVFIGKPNVGKSNILEGLGLLGANYSVDKLIDSVRYDSTRDLFYDNDIQNDIITQTDKYKATITNFNLVKDLCRYQFSRQSGKIISDYTVNAYGVIERSLDEDATQKIILSPVKKYDFINLLKFSGQFGDFLLPHSGRNLYAVINKRDELFTEMALLFREQGLELILSERDQTFLLQKKEGPRVKQYPFFSIADTFRRFMFYITAIESNKNSVIIFEEPEVHSFPPYVKALAHRIVYSDTNQFFVSTHSPYLLQTLIDELDESELAVYITYYKDYQTHVRQLKAEELREARDLSIDLFYNLSRYEPNA